MNRRDVIRIMLGIAGLGLGALIYLVDRPPELVYFISENNSFYTGYMTVFGSLGQHLPTFLHPFSFSLITAGVLVCHSTRCIALVGLVWFAIDLIFELGQTTSVSTALVEYIPAWFDQVVVLENMIDYLNFGTYDLKDVVSIAIGSLIAFVINHHLNQGGCAHEQKTSH